ncbi:hypothetical protein [Pseudomonas lopnurensis]|uniref:hypothetical protein n=1 Tax=Pseudomonas lopnurensis TaxID=1477517 RepID=UPI0028AB8D91|nr:hypothetical protein [Pseudomonas lopnurensis]
MNGLLLNKIGLLSIDQAYEPFAHSVFAGYAKVTAVTRETDVAEMVLKAASDVSSRLRFPAGADALALA